MHVSEIDDFRHAKTPVKTWFQVYALYSWRQIIRQIRIDLLGVTVGELVD
jgi:hypothetical protein